MESRPTHERTSVLAAIRRWFRSKRSSRQEEAMPQFSEKAKMNLALAIAEQYVLVAQDFPEINDNDSNGNDCDLDASTITHKSSSFWFSTYHHHSSTRAKHKRGGSGNSLFSRVWRPRTISNGSTVVCDSIDGTPLSSNRQGQMAAPPPALAASRERPVCC